MISLPIEPIYFLDTYCHLNNLNFLPPFIYLVSLFVFLLIYLRIPMLLHFVPFTVKKPNLVQAQYFCLKTAFIEGSFGLLLYDVMLGLHTYFHKNVDPSP